MTFQSSSAHQSVKAILISGPNCSGKSYLLKKISDNECFKDENIFEMDSLEYYTQDVLQKRLPLAWQKFHKWYSVQEENTLLEKLYLNIKLSHQGVQLIKLKLIEFMLHPESFVTVLPLLLRHNDQSIHFLELLESYFKCRIAHIAIIPSLPRFLLNLYSRKNFFTFRYVKKNLAERRRLISKKSCFDVIIHTSFFTKKNKTAFDALTRFKTGLN